MATLRRRVSYLVQLGTQRKRFHSAPALRRCLAAHPDACLLETRDLGWEAQVVRKGHKPVSRTFAKKAQAETWARRQEEEMARGVYQDRRPADLPIAALLARYERDITPRKRSAVKERSRLRLLGQAFGHLLLSRLQPRHVVDYADERLDEVSSDTVRKELATLAHAIDVAQALWGVVLPENPVRTAKRILAATGSLQPGVHRERRVTDEEIARVATHTGSAVLAALVVFAVETGMRRGELAAARREHLRGAALHIPRTKTGKARTIPLSSRALAVIEGLPARLDGRIFGVQPGSVSQALKRACKRAGVADLRFHDLRHEATSRLFERGLSIEEVALITGHADWSSLKRYTHPSVARVGSKLG